MKVIVKESADKKLALTVALSEAKATTKESGKTSIGIFFVKLSKTIILF
jgi:hypothetical protein